MALGDYCGHSKSCRFCCEQRNYKLNELSCGTDNQAKRQNRKEFFGQVRSMSSYLALVPRGHIYIKYACKYRGGQCTEIKFSSFLFV